MYGVEAFVQHEHLTVVVVLTLHSSEKFIFTYRVLLSCFIWTLFVRLNSIHNGIHETYFRRWMSRFLLRWRTQLTAKSSVTCRIQRNTRFLNAHGTLWLAEEYVQFSASYNCQSKWDALIHLITDLVDVIKLYDHCCRGSIFIDVQHRHHAWSFKISHMQPILTICWWSSIRYELGIIYDSIIMPMFPYHVITT